METTQTGMTGGSQYFDQDQLSMLQIRLDTNRILEKFEIFLRGQRLVQRYSKQGHMTVEAIDNPGMEKKCNEKGINDIMNFLHSNVNPQTVQGNFDDGQYIEHVRNIHHRLNEAMFLNFYEWGLTTGNYQMIISTIMPQINAFFTRLKGNLERESYIPMMKTVETYSHNEKQGLSNGFGLRSAN